MNVPRTRCKPIESDPIDQAADSLPVITRGRRSIARINHLAPIDYRYRYFPEVSTISSLDLSGSDKAQLSLPSSPSPVYFLSLSSTTPPTKRTRLNAWAGPSSFLSRLSRRVLGLCCRYCQRWPR